MHQLDQQLKHKLPKPPLPHRPPPKLQRQLPQGDLQDHQVFSCGFELKKQIDKSNVMQLLVKFAHLTAPTVLQNILNGQPEHIQDCAYFDDTYVVDHPFAKAIAYLKSPEALAHGPKFVQDCVYENPIQSTTTPTSVPTPTAPTEKRAREDSTSNQPKPKKKKLVTLSRDQLLGETGAQNIRNYLHDDLGFHSLE